MSGTVVTGLAGNVDAAEQSSFNKKRPREQDDEVRRKASSAISDEDGEELVSADSAYPPSRIKALVDDFRWIPVDPIRLKEFVTLKQWITNESLRQKNTEAMTQQGVRCSVDPAGGCTKNGNEIKEDIRIISRRECKRQLHVPLLSMVLNKIPKGRAPSRLSCPGGMDYPYTTVPKKADSLEWSGRCVLISSTEGRLLSFNGSRITELDISLDCYGCISCVARYTPIGSKSAGELDSYLFFGTSDGHLCVVCNDTFVNKIFVGSAVTCVEVCPDTAGDYTIAVGDASGYVSIFRPNGLNSFDKISYLPAVTLHENYLKAGDPVEFSEASCTVKAIVPIIVMKKSMQFFAYTIVCTEHNWISIFGFDEEIDRIHLPSRVTAITSGYFEHKRSYEKQDASSLQKRQIDGILNEQAIVFLEEGGFYLVWFGEDGVFRVSKWACSDSKITKINTLKSSLMYSARSRFRALESGVGPRRDHILLDYILCTGHFSGIEIWKNKQLLHVIETSDWTWDLVIDVCSVSKSSFSQNTPSSSVFKSRTVNKANSKVRVVAGLWNRVLECHLMSIYD